MVIVKAKLTSLLALVLQNHVEARGLEAPRLLATVQIVLLEVFRLPFRPKEEPVRLNDSRSAELNAEICNHFDLSVVQTLFESSEHLILVVVLRLLPFCEKTSDSHELLKDSWPQA